MRASMILWVALAANPTFADPSSKIATAALSDATRAILIREMQAIAEAMARIHRALATGDHATVRAQAEKIRDSFVLGQELSDAQRHEIHARLPPEFVVADRAFHHLAGQLAEAGRHADPALQRFWFAEMTRACQECHSAHAPGRFPGLAADDSSPHDH